MQYDATDPLEIFKPYEFTIEDSYGGEITLARDNDSIQAGVAYGLVIAVESYDEDGEINSASVSGTFFGDRKQNLMNFMTRLKGMKRVSDQNKQLLIFVSAHPQVAMRGYVSELDGPSVSPANPLMYQFSFRFSRDPEPYQPKVYKPLIQILSTGEGKHYTEIVVTSSDFTTPAALAMAYYGTTYIDHKKIQQILSLNNWTVDDERAFTIGDVVKMPLK